MGREQKQECMCALVVGVGERENAICIKGYRNI